MRCATLAAVLAATACAPRDDGAVTLSLLADPAAPGSEAYLCFGFDPPSGARAIEGIEVVPPPPGPVSIHHLTLYAVPHAFPDGPVECTAMPDDAVELSVWAPGGAALTLPVGVGLDLPATTRRLVAQAHALRTASGAAGAALVRLTLAREPPSLRAAWLPVRAPVPAIRPHQVEVATAACRVGGPLHLFSTWPHMHRLGTQFRGRWLGSDGSATPFITVDPWDADRQRAYPLDLDLTDGEAIESSCTWRNDGDAYVLPGPRLTDEMCGQSVIAWPAASAFCR